ncbi:MAG TPA: hypothetical protein VNU71_07110 [Burkholderiaceae bacterium]|nr:hypothetical protein [Burkholderiaceae bacterium]
MAVLKRHAWTVAAVAALLVLLALAGHSPDRQKSLNDYEAAGTMRHIATPDIVALQLATPQRELRFERRGAAWQRAGANAPLDAATGAAIESGLRLLHNTAPERSFDSAAPAFSLDPPALRVRAQTADGRWFEIDFGSTNPIGLARYVRTRSGGIEALLLMPAYVADAWEPLLAQEAR